MPDRTLSLRNRARLIVLDLFEWLGAEGGKIEDDNEHEHELRRTPILRGIPVFQLMLFTQFDVVTGHETGLQQFVDEMLEDVILLSELVESNLESGSRVNGNQGLETVVMERDDAATSFGPGE